MPHLVHVRVRLPDRDKVHAVRRLAVVRAHPHHVLHLLVQLCRHAVRGHDRLLCELRRVLGVDVGAPVAPVAVLLARQQLDDVARRDRPHGAHEVRHVDRLHHKRTRTCRRQVAPARGEIHRRRLVAGRERPAKLGCRLPSVRHRQPRLHRHLVRSARREVAADRDSLAPAPPVGRHWSRRGDDLHEVHQTVQVWHVRELKFKTAQFSRVKSCHERHSVRLGRLDHLILLAARCSHDTFGRICLDPTVRRSLLLLLLVATHNYQRRNQESDGTSGATLQFCLVSHSLTSSGKYSSPNVAHYTILWLDCKAQMQKKNERAPHGLCEALLCMVPPTGTTAPANDGGSGSECAHARISSAP